MEYDRSGININTDGIFQKNNDNKCKKTVIDIFYEIYEDFYKYTTDRENVLTNHEPLKIYSYDEKTRINTYENKYFKVSFLMLSDFVKDEKIKKELVSDSRLHKCHEESINVALGLENSASVLTGYIENSGQNILHSVVEIEENNELLIIDYTQNLVLRKGEYLYITGFKELSRVSKEDFKKDQRILSLLGIKVPYYLLFREEIIKDLKKNEKTLKLENL